MNTPKKTGMIVEDETVSAGTDSNGATVVAPKDATGHVHEGVKPTDAREAARPSPLAPKHPLHRRR